MGCGALRYNDISANILNIHRWTREDLLRVKGIGRVKAVQMLCLSELAKRLSKASAASGLNFSAPDTIAQYYMEDMRHQLCQRA